MAAAPTPYRIGLTGGIASGKTTVSDLFASRGVPVIDSDVIARDVVAPGQPALQAIVARFGPQVLQADGSLDRRQLRTRVFADPAARRDLEAITHPAIRAEMDRRSALAGGEYQILAIPLLVEGGGRGRVARVLVVDCPESLQLQRLMARDGTGEAQARAMIAAQASREARLAVADDVIVNDGDLERLRERVGILDAQYRAAARADAE
jgi:dephospho-CoA kinase